jgi:hypothetical protein
MAEGVFRDPMTLAESASFIGLDEDSDTGELNSPGQYQHAHTTVRKKFSRVTFGNCTEHFGMTGADRELPCVGIG